MSEEITNVQRVTLKKLNKTQLEDEFKNILIKSGLDVVMTGRNYLNYPFYDVRLNNGRLISVIPRVKNITGAGWKDKPEILRIQINNVIEKDAVIDGAYFLLCGITYYDNNPILIVWNTRNYITHNTNCSCYVFVSTLDRISKEGFYFGSNKGKDVMGCTEYEADKLLTEYSSLYL